MKLFSILRNFRKKEVKELDRRDVERVASFIVKKRSDVLKDLAEYDRGIKKEYQISRR